MTWSHEQICSCTIPSVCCLCRQSEDRIQGEDELDLTYDEELLQEEPEPPSRQSAEDQAAATAEQVSPRAGVEARWKATSSTSPLPAPDCLSRIKNLPGLHSCALLTVPP